MECHRPLAVPIRFALVHLDRVDVGRGSSRRHARQIVDGRREMRVEVSDEWMSTSQFALVQVRDGWTLVDDGSKNRTLVNGRPAVRANLADGDVIASGNTVFLYRATVPIPPGEPLDYTPARAHSDDRQMTICGQLQRDFEVLTRIARSDVPVLIQGETGTGKELVARYVHTTSSRVGSFTAVNCGALPSALIESELFGAKRGAFSGAVRDREGLVSAADGGTLFLDEVAELSVSSQTALLRVLQQHEVVPVGATTPEPVNLRVVAATHRDLAALVDANAFREDLYARLAGHVIKLPALRERREDLGLLVAELLRAIAPERADALVFKRSAVRHLFHYSWPRNIRELELALRAAIAMTTGGELAAEHLPESVRRSVSAERSEPPVPPTPEEARNELRTLLERYRGNVASVARVIGTSRSQVRRLAKRYDLEIDSFRDS